MCPSGPRVSIRYQIRLRQGTGREYAGIHIAVLIPCFNEGASITKVIGDFQAALPNAVIYVYDNSSTDDTIMRAEAAHAIVRDEPLQGKGHVVRRMFADIDADVYVLVDGDDTYAAEAAPRMVDLLIGRQLDMVSAARAGGSAMVYRPGHRLGNAVLTGMVRWVFGDGISDMLSGYRVLSRRFVKSFPALSAGFETETELTIHALALHLPLIEISAEYRSRGPGSASKLNTVPRRNPHSAGDRDPDPAGAAVAGRFGSGRCAECGWNRAWHPRCPEISRHRRGASPADGPVVHRPYAAGVYHAGLRPDP